MLDIVVASPAPFAFPTNARTRGMLREIASEKAARIFFVEPTVLVEPSSKEDGATPRLEVGSPAPGIYTLTPLLPASGGATVPTTGVTATATDISSGAISGALDGTTASSVDAIVGSLLNAFFDRRQMNALVLWYTSTDGLAFARHLHAAVIVYECADVFLEKAHADSELFARADMVLVTEGALSQSKRTLHPHIYALPSPSRSVSWKSAGAQVASILGTIAQTRAA